MNPWWHPDNFARQKPFLHKRQAVIRAIRAFFDGQGFVETRTPIRVPCPGLEPHIKPVALTAGGFLHTSPEFAMKRLLVGGLERIYQLATVFRDEPHAPTHLAEFCMLEWYRAYADEHAIMEDTEQLVATLKDTFPFAGARCNRISESVLARMRGRQG